MTTASRIAQQPAFLRDRVMRAGLNRMSPGGAGARLSIVIFHRVHPEPDPLYPGEVHRAHFDAVCRWLAAWYRVLPLDEAVRRLQRDTLPERALAITFDDGYADNHDVALPVLRAHGLCATFFIATGFLDGGRMWNDTMAESIRRCPLPALKLADLNLAGVGHLDLHTIESRRQAVALVLNAAKYLEPAVRQAVVQEVALRSRASLPTDLMMTSSQLKAMAQAGMQIGAHTVSHPILSSLDDAAARREIAQSKADLESLLGQPVNLFAYPNGRPGKDYGARDVALARSLGFGAAVSTAHGAARQRTDPFQLPRFTPWDRGPWTFGARMLHTLTAGDARAC